MIELVAMGDADLAAFLTRPRDGFLAQLAELGLSPDAAASRVRDEQSAAFPGGRPAAGHQVFTVRLGSERVGHLWIGPAPDGGPGSWWVWEVQIDEGWQGQGLGRRTMEFAEAEARRAGATSLGLSVSGANTKARGLYGSLGYETLSVQMHKRLV